MLTKDVHYTEKPEKIIINRIGGTYMCRVDLPVDIREEVSEDGPSWVADVWSVTTMYTKNIAERIEQDYDEWLAKAMEVPAPSPTIDDVIEAVNALAEIVLGE